MHAGGASRVRPDQTLKPAGLVLTVGLKVFFVYKQVMYTILGCVVVVTALAVLLLVRRQFPGLRAPNLPPGIVQLPPLMEVNLRLIVLFTGPPCLPIIGNIHQMPKTGAHLKYSHAYSLYIHCSKITRCVQVYGMGIHLWPHFLTENGTTDCGCPKLPIHDQTTRGQTISDL